MSVHVLVLAGGTGTRLWPLSRAWQPKQLLKLVSEHTMLQQTVARIAPIVPLPNVYVATGRSLGGQVLEQLPGMPAANLILEPSGKGTAPCIGLGALQMLRRDPEAVMVSLHADHFIRDEETFRRAVLAAVEVAKEGYLVTLGIEPERPETGYGYVERAEPIGFRNGFTAFRVRQFLEKPDRLTAERFLASGEHYWNSGIFVWQISVLMDAYRIYLAEMYEMLKGVAERLHAGETIDDLWERIPPQSIDVGIMERAARVAVVPVNIGWSDIGSWAVIHELGEPDADGNVASGGEWIAVNTKNSLIRGKGRLIATVGLDGLIIVDTDDALLVCAQEHAQDVRLIVDALKKQGKAQYL